MAVMSHLASLHIRSSSSTFADDVLMQTSLIQSHLETTASALSLLKSFIHSNVPDLDEPDRDEDSNEPGLIEKLDAFVSHARGAKVIAGKTHRALTELKSRSLVVQESSMADFAHTEQEALTLAAFARNAGESLQALFGEEGRVEPYTVSEVNLTLTRLTTNFFNLAGAESTTMATVANRIRALTDQLNSLATVPADTHHVIEFERLTAPWVIRSAEIRATKLTTVDTEAEVARLTEIVRERSLLVRTKEQELEEQSVRIEMLEARMAEAQRRSAQLSDLEDSLHTFKQTEQSLHDQLSGAREDVKRLRQERDDLRHQAVEYQVATKDVNAPNTEYGGVASRVELDRAKVQERSLKATIRYLQGQSTITPTMLSTSDSEWLEMPLFPAPMPQQQQLGLLESEAKSVFSELLNVAARSKPVRIGLQASKDRLAWRPAQDTTAWAAQKKREEWETWVEWQNDLLSRAKGATNEATSGPFWQSKDSYMAVHTAVCGVIVVDED